MHAPVRSFFFCRNPAYACAGLALNTSQRAAATRRTGGPLDGSDPGPAMVPVLEHVDAIRGGYGSGGGSGFGSGSGFGGGAGAGGAGAGAGAGPGGATISTAGDGLVGIGGGGGGDSGSGAGGGMGGLGSGGGVGDTPGRFRGEGAGGNFAAENLMSFEPAFGYGAGGGGAGSGGGLSPTSMGAGGAHGSGGGFQGTAIETQQYELQMRMVDILMESLQYARALRCVHFANFVRYVGCVAGDDDVDYKNVYRCALTKGRKCAYGQLLHLCI